MTDKKILILKNDRVGDLFHAINGINSIINKHKDYDIEIILSNYSKEMSFLFNIKNIKISILNYNLNLFEKFFLFKYLIASEINCEVKKVIVAHPSSKESPLAKDISKSFVSNDIFLLFLFI